MIWDRGKWGEGVVWLMWVSALGELIADIHVASHYMGTVGRGGAHM